VIAFDESNERIRPQASQPACSVAVEHGNLFLKLSPLFPFGFRDIIPVRCFGYFRCRGGTTDARTSISRRGCHSRQPWNFSRAYFVL
jgi:hypothetical protein